MKTPKFWKKKSFISKILTPLGLVYNYITQRRIRLVKSQKANLSVICIGNISVGGGGKTPCCIEVAKILLQENKKVFFLSRGYKSKLKNLIIEDIHSSVEVGDEPLLLKKIAPVVIAPDRVLGAKIASSNKAEVMILDDGFQNPYLYKDFSFLVIDGEAGLGNGLIFPAGPLRESLENGVKRAGAIIIIGQDKFNLALKIQSMKDIPILSAKIIPNPAQISELLNKKVIAFAGIARPEKFYKTLRQAGVEVAYSFDFPDHHYFSDKELNNIITQAEKINASIVTTEKDFVRIPKKYQKSIKILEITLELDKVALREILKNVVS